MIKPTAENNIVQNDENESVAEEMDWRDENTAISLAAVSAIYVGLGIEPPKILLNDNDAISEELE